MSSKWGDVFETGPKKGYFPPYTKILEIMKNEQPNR